MALYLARMNPHRDILLREQLQFVERNVIKGLLPLVDQEFTEFFVTSVMRWGCMGLSNLVTALTIAGNPWSTTFNCSSRFNTMSSMLPHIFRGYSKEPPAYSIKEINSNAKLDLRDAMFLSDVHALHSPSSAFWLSAATLRIRTRAIAAQSAADGSNL